MRDKIKELIDNAYESIDWSSSLAKARQDTPLGEFSAGRVSGLQQIVSELEVLLEDEQDEEKNV